MVAECGGYSFTAKGKELLDTGWRAYAELPQDAALPEGLSEGLTLPVEEKSARGVVEALLRGL